MRKSILIYFSSYQSLRESAKELDPKQCFELDVDPGLRFLAEKKIKSQVIFEGEPTHQDERLCLFSQSQGSPRQKGTQNKDHVL